MLMLIHKMTKSEIKFDDRNRTNGRMQTTLDEKYVMSKEINIVKISS